MGDWPGEEVAHGATDGHAEHEQCEGAGAFRGGDEVADPTGGRGSDDRFADAHAEAGDQQVCEVLGEGVHGGENAPNDDAEDEEGLALHAVGHEAEGHADDGVDPDEG